MVTLLITGSDESWLNMTNAILGGITVVCLLVVIIGVFRTLLEKIRARRLFLYGDHVLRDPELGLTMADGGEAVDQKNRK